MCIIFCVRSASRIHILKGVSRIYLYLVYFCILYFCEFKIFFFSLSFKFSHKCINIRIIYNTFFFYPYEFYITSLSKRGIYCIFKVRSFFRLNYFITKKMKRIIDAKFEEYNKRQVTFYISRSVWSALFIDNINQHSSLFLH